MNKAMTKGLRMSMLHPCRQLAPSLLASWIAVSAGSTAQEPPPGFEILQIAESEDARYPRLNECGQTVYSYSPPEGGGGQIILYDNGRYDNISDNAVNNVLPDINNRGVMTWTWSGDGTGNGKIVVLTRGHLVFLRRGWDPAINDSGHIAFDVRRKRSCALERDIYYYDGVVSHLVYRGQGSNQSTSIDRSGGILWTRYDFCVDPWRSDMGLWREKVISIVELGDEQAQLPSLNDQGVAAWSSPFGITVWDDHKSRMLTTDDSAGPVLNNRGSVYFFRTDQNLQRRQPWLYRDGAFHRLLVDPLRSHVIGDINDHDECVWSAWMYDGSLTWSIWLMRRIRTGEADFDGDIDLSDYAEAARCMDGPDFLERHRTDPTDTLCECRFLDLDHDNDVDLADVARFQNAFAPGA